MTYYTMGKIGEAAEVFRQWLADEPAHPVARHMHAACSGRNVPERAPDDYVEYTFDRFADSFETQLNERLHYQAPQLCAALLKRHLPAPQHQYTMLDAGCGTGLSRGMLDRAQNKGVYTDLYKAELTEFLQTSPGQWDVVLSADTLCYFGDLQAVMQAAAGSLQPGGTLVYTVEQLPDDAAAPFRLEPHGRYAHARQHVEQALAAAGLRVLEISEDMLRKEGGKPVAGWLVAARRDF
jgi:predicted TPR repeat methyltransferase